MNINRELLKGSTVILILKLLNEKPMYGYEMIKKIEKRSNGIFSFKEGTLYPILHSLENNNFVESYWDDTNGKRKRKYYKITEKGTLELKDKKEEWVTFTSTINHILGEAIVCH
ncbi:PadR family transcriptional regulator [Clostridium botulinum]|uniref:PadR family transcriptional regulator n=1 Tax=Clostridium botulinum TaxID=1491 RepID=UPI000307E7B2|nr:PadR family transcriptional regulator [Clostridium botulinum]KLU74939.1 DNA-binding protein [Clostridium botulinum V891]KOA73997.1 DNA-binding protein [Clostridium botulinum]KOA92884.1 DNA-binding protein [Clostridium botulinum]KOC34237.1 DNA-binding protein [Clostridium botulinum]MCD3201782.1 PadR family transcriptional regulator [Clostridium botulinum C/D]